MKLEFYSKKPSELVVKFGSDESSDVKEIVMHPDFFKSIETLQDNIVKFILFLNYFALKSSFHSGSFDARD